MLVESDGTLAGLFTDSDLARLFEQRRDKALDRPISEVMTHRPITVPIGTRVMEAVDVIRNRKISELPVVDALGRPDRLDRHHGLDRRDVRGGDGGIEARWREPLAA